MSKKTDYWLSFCDLDKPKGQQFLGVAIGRASSLRNAVLHAWYMGINPGGEVLSLELDEENSIPAECWNKLLSKADLARFGLIES